MVFTKIGKERSKYREFVDVKQFCVCTVPYEINVDHSPPVLNVEIIFKTTKKKNRYIFKINIKFRYQNSLTCYFLKQIFVPLNSLCPSLFILSIVQQCIYDEVNIFKSTPINAIQKWKIG